MWLSLPWEVLPSQQEPPWCSASPGHCGDARGLQCVCVCVLLQVCNCVMCKSEYLWVYHICESCESRVSMCDLHVCVRLILGIWVCRNVCDTCASECVCEKGGKKGGKARASQGSLALALARTTGYPGEFCVQGREAQSVPRASMDHQLCPPMMPSTSPQQTDFEHPQLARHCPPAPGETSVTWTSHQWPRLAETLYATSWDSPPTATSPKSRPLTWSPVPSLPQPYLHVSGRNWGQRMEARLPRHTWGTFCRVWSVTFQSLQATSYYSPGRKQNGVSVQRYPHTHRTPHLPCPPGSFFLGLDESTFNPGPQPNMTHPIDRFPPCISLLLCLQKHYWLHYSFTSYALLLLEGGQALWGPGRSRKASRGQERPWGVQGRTCLSAIFHLKV